MSSDPFFSNSATHVTRLPFCHMLSDDQFDIPTLYCSISVSVNLKENLKKFQNIPSSNNPITRRNLNSNKQLNLGKLGSPQIGSNMSRDGKLLLTLHPMCEMRKHQIHYFVSSSPSLVLPHFLLNTGKSCKAEKL